MDQLLSVNPGLASRFTTRVDFPSYDSAELISIAHDMAAAGHNSFDESAAQELKAIMTSVCESGRIDELGNARFARNLYEKSIAQRDLRLADSNAPLTKDAITTITSDDLMAAVSGLVR